MEEGRGRGGREEEREGEKEEGKWGGGRERKREGEKEREDSKKLSADQKKLRSMG